MDWTELLAAMQLDKDIIVTITKPVRNGEPYTHGRLTGFKCGIFGGGHYNYKDGMPQSYDSTRRHFIKPPKVHVTYNIFQFGGKEHSDWIDVANCIFEINPCSPAS